MNVNVIAIDGPAASGKSTVARRVASARGSFYVDSGSLYRAVAWRILEAGIDPADHAAVASAALRFDPEFFTDGIEVRFRIEGRILGGEIRTETVNRAVSVVAAIPEVREQVTGRLRSLLRFGKLVMEGRDIGTAVFPDAAHKFYLQASEEERARRRHAEMSDAGQTLPTSTVKESIVRRDRLDSGRKIDPLKIAPDALVIDTTGQTIEQVVTRILDAILD